MHTPIPLSGTPRLLLAAAVWALLLVGLVVMHGAGSHGTTAHASAPTGDVLELTVDPDGPPDHESTAHSGDPAQHSEDGGESPGHSTAELCLAILCALLSALAAFVALTRPSRPLFIRRRVLTALVSPWLRPPAPPSLTHLSILRC